MTYYKWLRDLFIIALEIDGNLDKLSTETVMLQYNLAHKLAYKYWYKIKD